MKLTRRGFLKMGAGSLGAGLAGAAFPTIIRAARRKPNVLFIAVDDLRPQLGCYGRTQMISPNIDALAGEGVAFRRAYCQVPVCGASRASLLKGVRPTRTRFVGYSTRADKDLPGAVSLPLHFRSHGYVTISNGKVYHHRNDDIKAWTERPWGPRSDWYGGWCAYRAEESRRMIEEGRKAGNKKARGPAFEAADVPDDKYPDGMIAEKAISDLRRLKSAGKPFFLATGFLKPHLPFNAPRKYWDLYERDGIDLADNPFRPKDAPDAAIHNSGELRAYAGIPRKGPVSKDIERSLVHGYYACVSYTDAQIGRVMGELDRLGLRRDTIVVLWGDHGWNLNEHGLWCKHCNFHTSLNAPMIVSAPGMLRGKTSNALTEFVDIYPTLSELAGLPLPEHLEGTSCVPLLEDPDRPWKTAAFSRYYSGDSIRTDRYLYTEWHGKWRGDKKGNLYARMLYDHRTDPKENVNIAERPENAALVRRLSSQLKAGWKAAMPPA